MKRCPKCGRSFPDENQKFCTIDGGLLVAAEKPFDPNATIQGPPRRAIPVEPQAGKPVSNELPDFEETIAASAPTVVFPKQTGPTGSATAPDLPPPPAPPLPQPQSVAVPQAQSATLPRPQSVPLPPVPGAPVKKKSKL